MIIVENLIDQFLSEVKVTECKAFYGLQAHRNDHSETYALMLSKFSPNEKERLRLARAVHTIPCIKGKSRLGGEVYGYIKAIPRKTMGILYI